MARRGGPTSAHRLIERQMAMYHAQQRAVKEAGEAGPRRAAPVAEAPPRLPYVTISRQYGAGGSAMASALAEALGWTLYDRELLEAIAHDARLQERLLEPFDEQERDNMEHWIRGLLTEETVSEHHYTHALFRVLSSIGRVGNAVIVGRGAHLALPAVQGVRVRVYAPLAARLERVVREETLSEAEARRKLDRVERTRQNWMLRAYGERAKEPMAFDLALNPSALPVDACVQIVLLALHAKCGVALPGA